MVINPFGATCSKIVFPIAKINLGLNVVERREDGYHNLETVFFPVPLKDALEIHEMNWKFPSIPDCDIKVSNIDIEGSEQNNLVVKAYKLLKQDFPRLPRQHVHLYKNIPTQAGLGGGSSDCAAMLKLLNDKYELGLSEKQLFGYAVRLGADCPFFIMGQPAYAEGIGERLTPIDLDLKNYWVLIVKPNIAVSTKEAFSLITPQRPEHNCLDIIKNQPVSEWRHELKNDFEQSVFALYPEIGDIKQHIYDMGAEYAAMSGSGSAVFGLFNHIPDLLGEFGDMYKQVVKIV